MAAIPPSPVEMSVVDARIIGMNRMCVALFRVQDRLSKSGIVRFTRPLWHETWCGWQTGAPEIAESGRVPWEFLNVIHACLGLEFIFFCRWKQTRRVQNKGHF